MAGKCNNCNKKLGMMSFSCDCNNKYCIKCRNPESHNCNFDHKNKEKQNLENKMVKLDNNKIDKL